MLPSLGPSLEPLSGCSIHLLAQTSKCVPFWNRQPLSLRADSQDTVCHSSFHWHLKTLPSFKNLGNKSKGKSCLAFGAASLTCQLGCSSLSASEPRRGHAPWEYALGSQAPLRSIAEHAPFPTWLSLSTSHLLRPRLQVSFSLSFYFEV